MIETLIFALVAGFFCHRLWTVLGRRDGDAPPQIKTGNPFAKPLPLASENTSDRTGAPEKNWRDPLPPLPVDIASDPSAPRVNYEPASLDKMLTLLKQADPGFDERSFLGGAKTAFQTIMQSFALGDRQALRPLLSDDVYKLFDAAIANREVAHHTMDVRIVKVDATIEIVRLTGATARVTVDFRSLQVTLVRGQDGTVIEGDARRMEDVIDIWTFARDTRARDPNWTLVETHHREPENRPERPPY